MLRDIERLRSDGVEVLIVGGGVHGAWLALRSAEAGYDVGLIERDDFGGGTSANSLNILHGGLRYLQHLDIARMRKSIRARRDFSRRFPHLVRPLPCVMPLASVGIRSPWVLGPALALNDIVSADRNSGVTKLTRLPRGRLLGSVECRSSIEGLTDLETRSGALWWDALSLDSERLTLSAVIESARLGATVANRVEALNYLQASDAIAGVVARDRVSGQEFEIHAKVVVNAMGPWAGELAAASGLQAPYLPEHWVGALNLVFCQPYGGQAAVALSSMGKAADGSAVFRRRSRELFFVPWRGGTAVGTDYIPLVSAREGENGPPPSMIENFVAEVQRVAPRFSITSQHLAGIHWGILPAEESAAALPMRSPVLASGHRETGLAGLVVVVGEKLTSAPVLSLAGLSRIRRELKPILPRPTPRSRSADLEADTNGAVARVPPKDSAAQRLEARYGDQYSSLFARYRDDGKLFEPILPTSDILTVEIVHAIRSEMALSLADIVLRRLALGALGNPGDEVLRRCAEVAAPEFGWNPADIEAAVTELKMRFASSGQAPDSAVAAVDRLQIN